MRCGSGMSATRTCVCDTLISESSRGVTFSDGLQDISAQDINGIKTTMYAEMLTLIPNQKLNIPLGQNYNECLIVAVVVWGWNTRSVFPGVSLELKPDKPLAAVINPHTVNKQFTSTAEKEI